MYTGGGKGLAPVGKSKAPSLKGGDKKHNDTRMNNILAGKAISDVVRTSLGPRGMDKMVSRVFTMDIL
jgi:T-complex protein 1 subunit delta